MYLYESTIQQLVVREKEEITINMKKNLSIQQGKDLLMRSLSLLNTAEERRELFHLFIPTLIQSKTALSLLSLSTTLRCMRTGKAYLHLSSESSVQEIFIDLNILDNMYSYWSQGYYFHCLITEQGDRVEHQKKDKEPKGAQST